MTRTGVVTKFQDEFSFLSNFYEAPFIWHGATYKTAEHAFQAAKGYHIRSGSEADYMKAVRATPTPAKVKREGRSVNIDVDSWNSMRVKYMREIVHAKFGGSTVLSGQLMDTGVMLLVEGNTWGDTFWGRCAGKGLNTLGAILMEERGYWIHGTFKDPNRPAWEE